jgi:hypothetical protein
MSSPFPHFTFPINWNALSAVGTFSAVLVALFYPPLRKWWNAPRLKLTLRHRDSEESVDDMPWPDPTGLQQQRRWRRYRLFVRNKGKEAAAQVEVTINDVYRDYPPDGRFGLMFPFTPARLRWTETGECACNYLPFGARVCEFGTFEHFEPSKDNSDASFSLAVGPRVT